MRFTLNININNIMESGQVFSYENMGDHYRIYSADKACVAYLENSHTVVICNTRDEKYWKSYFNAERFEKVRKQLSEEKNEFLKMCYENASGMVILRQDLWETICSYIISQRNNIPAIKKSLLKFRKKMGEKRNFQADGYMFEYYTFPTAEQLKDIQKEDLSDLSFGYRDKYILDAIRWYQEDMPKYNFTNMTYDKCLAHIMEIKGVGIKVASCINLFAFNDLTSFPVDVWIQRIMDSGKLTWEDVERYKDNAGYINQIIYFFAIHHRNYFRKENENES